MLFLKYIQQSQFYTSISTLNFKYSTSQPQYYNGQLIKIKQLKQNAFTCC